MTWDKISAILYRENLSCDAIDYAKTIFDVDEEYEYGVEVSHRYFQLALAFDAGMKHANKRPANATADSRG